MTARSGRGVSRPPTTEPTHSELLGLVAANYPSIASALLRPLLDLYIVSRAACGGDNDKFLIMLVVGVRATEHPDFARYSQAQLLSGEIPVFPSLGTNVRSVADSVGAPRETVRRKVGELVAAGWIHLHEGELCFTAFAYQQLTGSRESLEELVVRNYRLVDGLLPDRPS